MTLSTGTDVTQSASYLVDKYDLTPSQAIDQLEREVLAEEVAGNLEEQLANNPDFGGMWMDHSAGGRLVVAGKSRELLDAATARVSSRAVAVASGPDLIDHRIVDHSLTTLQSLLQKIETVLDMDGEGLPFFSASLIPRDNHILVEVGSDTPHDLRLALEELEQSAPAGAVTVVDAPWERLDSGGEACPVSNCRMRGALEVFGETLNAQAYSCSVGFTATLDWGDRQEVGFLTAGHCAWMYQTEIYHGSQKVGRERLQQDSGSVDAAFVDMTAEAEGEALLGTIWRTGEPELPIKRVGTRDGTILGWVVCRSGFKSHGQFSTSQQNTCGEHISRSVSKSGNTGLGRVEHSGACKGDSGGPWYRQRDNAALGLHVTSDIATDACPSPKLASGLEEDSYFSYVSEINSGFNTTIHLK